MRGYLLEIFNANTTQALFLPFENDIIKPEAETFRCVAQKLPNPLNEREGKCTVCAPLQRHYGTPRYTEAFFNGVLKGTNSQVILPENLPESVLKDPLFRAEGSNPFRKEGIWAELEIHPDWEMHVQSYMPPLWVKSPDSLIVRLASFFGFKGKQAA